MILYETKYLQLKSTKAVTGNDWVYAHRPNAHNVVVILPLISNDKILFLVEQRPPLCAENIANYSIGLPAGLVGDENPDESIEDAINKELIEEAGLVADKIQIMTRKAASSPGCVTETVTIAIAYISEYNIIKEPVSDGGVIVDRVLVDKEHIVDWLNEKEAAGYALTTQTLAALFYLNKI